MGIAIDAQDIGKRYYLNRSIRARIKNALNPFGADRKDFRKEFWALKNLNFTIREGESVGIIGSNGAGKSTILKILSRVTKPTTGNFRTHGRIGALIEVGAGFSPDFTGRENIYLNASILGMSRREVNSKFEEIVEFAGIEDFIDTPVKHYSSGMYVRLGFAIAAHINPEILLVDEILAVGDLMFQKKCFNKIRSFRDQGKTFILVTHDLYNVEYNCKRVIYISKGIVRFDGTAQEGIALYLNDITNENELARRFSPLAQCKNTGDIEVLDVKIIGENGNDVDEITYGDDMIVEIGYLAVHPIHRPKVEIGIVSDGVTIGQTNTHTDGGPAMIAGRGRLRCTIRDIPLVFGNYYLNLFFSDGQTGADLLVVLNAKAFKVRNPGSIRIAWGIPGFIRFSGNWESVA